MMSSLLARLGLVTLALVVTQIAVGAAYPLDLPPAPASPGVLLAWAVASNGLIAGLLVGFTTRARVGRAPLWAVLVVVLGGIGHAAALLEAVVFDVLPAGLAGRLLAVNLVPLAVGAAVAVWTAPRPAPSAATSGPEAVRPVVAARLGVARVALLAGAYTGLYLVAGMLVYPFVEAYYATRVIPPLWAVLLLQLLVRGPLLAALCTLLLRALDVSRPGAALACAACLAVAGGAAPLILPNPIFPDSVRWPHLVEVGTSNALFGLIVGFVVTAARRPQGEPAPGAVTASRTA